MKFEKVMDGWYRTGNYRYELINFIGFWTARKKVDGEMTCIGTRSTLKEAKALCERDARNEKGE